MSIVFKKKQFLTILYSVRVFQILRGDTHNYIFVDESCFVRPALYGEVVPMLLTDNGHMVLTSSHKSGQDARSYIDMNSLRQAEILINNIAHVCRNHILSMLDNEIAAMSCLCYLFHQPHHITADSDYRRILNAFSQRSGGEHQEDEAINCKTAMLSEIGILPPGAALKDIRDGAKRQLATRKGKERFCSELVRVSDYTYGENTQLVFAKEVVVYIDPTPTDVGRSLHAMCFVARAERVQRVPGDTRFHYVLLAAEEFATEDIECWDGQRYGVAGGGGDGMNALANVFMTTIGVLTRLYEGYFTTYIVAPEANGIHVDPFWTNCSAIYARNPDLFSSRGITILSTTIPSPSNRKKRDGPQKFPKHSSRKSRAGPYSVNADVLETDNYESSRKSSAFRIGYVLGSEKVGKIYNFYSTMYNPPSGNVNSVTCAIEIWGWTLMRKSDSVPYYIAKSLELLEIRPSVNHITGKTAYKIGGKRTDGKGGFIQDDLAIAVVMSVSLCEQISTGQYKGDLVRLEPNSSNLHEYELEEEEDDRFSYY